MSTYDISLPSFVSIRDHNDLIYLQSNVSCHIVCCSHVLQESVTVFCHHLRLIVHDNIPLITLKLNSFSLFTISLLFFCVKTSSSLIFPSRQKGCRYILIHFTCSTFVFKEVGYVHHMTCQ